MAVGPRYIGATELIELIIALQASTMGMTIEQVQDRFGIGRRTAERRLAALQDLFVDDLVGELDPNGSGRKRWRLLGQGADRLISLQPDEIAALETALELIARDGRPDQAGLLRGLMEKVRALTPAWQRGRIETDLGALLEAEGLAMRPGPRPRIPREHVSILREAVLACRTVRLDYQARISGEHSTRDLHPYGFLFGSRHYLLARDPARGPAMRMFSLSEIQRVQLLDEYFERDEDFDLRAWAAQSFGVWQGDSFDVVWRVSPGAAAQAREYQFHPSQQLEDQTDGSLLVRFRASGLWEMACHVFEWRGELQVLEPPELRQTLVEFLEAVLEAHKEATP